VPSEGADCRRLVSVIWQDNGEPVELEELLVGGPVLLLFYLFDWSAT
jgi:hypothetical protein